MSYTLEMPYKGYKVLVNFTELRYSEEKDDYLCHYSFRCDICNWELTFMSKIASPKTSKWLKQIDDIVNDNRNKHELGKEEN